MIHHIIKGQKGVIVLKIEKVNDRQIRCILTSEDLASRHLKINELAYGSEKAKDLFRDMMQQASFEFGFEAEDIPLMIEAIPLNNESIVLIITKVDEPEELDTRFSKFAPSVSQTDEDAFEDPDEGASSDSGILSNIPEEVQALFNKVNYALSKQSEQTESNGASSSEEKSMRIYRFELLSEIVKVAHILHGYQAPNAIYKDPEDGSYVLLVNQGSKSKEEFAKINHVIAEFGKLMRSVPASYYHIAESYQPILKSDALNQLAQL